ncbi:MAG: MFS transporter [Verrucomicrobiota bacterium]
MDNAERTAITFRHEQWRAVTTGMLETAGATFLLLIAVRWFQAGALAKGLVAGGGSMGLLATPLTVWLVSRRGWAASKAAACLSLAGAACCLVMAVFPVLPVFVLGSMLATASAAAGIPLLTQIYQENYPDDRRGKLFSRTIMIRIAVAAIFSDLAGRALSHDLGHFQWLLVTFALAFLGTAFCLNRIPSRPLTNDGGAHPFHSLRFAKEDALFRRTLICWMLMGSANLMMLPLRIEYLANPKYKLALAVSTIALLTGVIPNVARLCLSPLWGWLFDRMNFFTLRIVLNLGFAVGILAFFTSNTMTGLVLGAIVFGISNAGGDVAWSLWVTKLAPPERVADYMSVHTFFTGVRGVLAPLIAFPLAAQLSLMWLAALCTGLIVLASVLLLPEIKFGKTMRKGTALVEEVAD